MKATPGAIVWARLAGQVPTWWPGQVVNPHDACDEALCRQLPNHALVCLYGSYRWAWVPVNRIEEFEPTYQKHLKEEDGCKAWQQAVEEAKEASDRSRGRSHPTKHNPPSQLQIRPGSQPVAGVELVFGQQQHPRAVSLMVTLQKGANSANGGHGSSSRGNNRSSDSGGTTERSGGGAGRDANGGEGGPSSSRSAAANKVAYSIPAWPEFFHESSATAADVAAIDAAGALTWLRSLARGTLPATQVTPEQEVAARRQLSSLDLARRQCAVDSTMQESGMAGSLANMPSSPKLPNKKTNSRSSSGLQPGTHSLSLPEDVARALTPIKEHLQQEALLQQIITSLEVKTEGAAPPPRRTGGGGNVLGTSTVDLMLRINGHVLPFTCPVTVQTIAQVTAAAAERIASSVAAMSPSQLMASVLSGANPSVVIQHRIGLLHTVLQQLIPPPIPGITLTAPPPQPQASTSSLERTLSEKSEKSGSAGAGAGTGTSEKSEKERQAVPGPIVEGWQVLGPHQLLLSLTVSPHLLHVTWPCRPPVLPSGRASTASTDAAANTAMSALTSPRAPSAPPPIHSPSAALLATYGIMLPSASNSGKKRPAALQVPGAGDKQNPGLSVVSPRSGMPTISFPSQRRQSDAGNNGEGGRGGSQPLKRLKTAGSCDNKRGSGQSGASAAAMANRPAWSSRVTPYDPSDPFSHPLLGRAGSLRSHPSGSGCAAPVSPTAETARQQARGVNPFCRADADGGSGGGSGPAAAAAAATMGPPQPRQQSVGGLPCSRRHSDTAYLATLQPINTGNGPTTRTVEPQQPQQPQDSVCPMDEDTPETACGSGGCEAVNATLRLLSSGGSMAEGAAGGGAAAVAGGDKQNQQQQQQQQPGVLLVEIRVGRISSCTSIHTSATLPPRVGSKRPPVAGAPAGDESAGGAGKEAGEGAGSPGGAGSQGGAAQQKARWEKGLQRFMQHLHSGVYGPLANQRGVGAAHNPLAASAHQQMQPQASLQPPPAGNGGPPGPAAWGHAAARAQSGVLGSAVQPEGAQRQALTPLQGQPQPPPQPQQQQQHAMAPMGLEPATDAESDAAELHKRSSWVVPATGGGALHGTPSPEPEPEHVQAPATAHGPSHHHHAAAAAGTVQGGAQVVMAAGTGPDAGPEQGRRNNSPGSQAAAMAGAPSDQGPNRSSLPPLALSMFATPLPPSVVVPTTPQLDTPTLRAQQTPEGQVLQGLGEQLGGAAHAVRSLLLAPGSKPVVTAAMLQPATMEVLTALREKAAAVAGRVMVGCMTTGDSQLRAEPLQVVLATARDTLAACDAAAATTIASHALANSSALRNATTANLLAASVQQHMGAAVGASLNAYAGVASAAAALLHLLGSNGDEEDEDETGDENGRGSESGVTDEDEEGGQSSSGASKSVSEERPVRQGPLGGLDDAAIASMQALAQPLAELVPSASAALHALVAQASLAQANLTTAAAATATTAATAATSAAIASAAPAEAAAAADAQPAPATAAAPATGATVAAPAATAAGGGSLVGGQLPMAVNA